MKAGATQTDKSIHLIRMRHVFGWMGQIRVQLAEQLKKHFVENHPEHFNIALGFTVINEKKVSSCVQSK